MLKILAIFFITSVTRVAYALYIRLGLRCAQAVCEWVWKDTAGMSTLCVRSIWHSQKTVSEDNLAVHIFTSFWVSCRDGK